MGVLGRAQGHPCAEGWSPDEKRLPSCGRQPTLGTQDRQDAGHLSSAPSSALSRCGLAAGLPHPQPGPEQPSRGTRGSEDLPAVLLVQVGQQGIIGSVPACNAARDLCNNAHKPMWEIELATETHTEFTLFDKILQAQINFPRPVFIVSSISREATSAVID